MDSTGKKMFGWVEKDGDLGDSTGPTSPEETVYVGQTIDPNVVINVNPCFRWSDLSAVYNYNLISVLVYFYSSRATFGSCVRSTNIDDRPTTDDRPQGILTHFAKNSNGHNSRQPIPFMFGSRVGFWGTADRTASFPVGSNKRWRPVDILKKLNRHNYL